MPTPQKVSSRHARALELARTVLRTEAGAVEGLAQRLDGQFTRAVDLVLDCRGRVVVSGIGKSGHIARKIAATLASTGTPALFVHAAEAMHGDLGMITRADVLVALSYSGEGGELLTMLPVAKREGTPLVAMTGNPASSLARLADVHLDVHVDKEACPLNLAPTSSTTAMLALGDALAVACLDARGFGPDDFARSHPAGALGRRLLTYVRDVMRTGDRIPRVTLDTSMIDALHEISRKQIGMTAVVDAAGRLQGIFTDGDLRRLLERSGDVRDVRLADVMTRQPLTIAPDVLAAEAAQLMDQRKKNQLLVLDADGMLVGALHMHDLMAAKVI
ncbi:MAG: KpsF/GutQ family sugar-phosphate isomerase [Burkholderiaceae bacterium]|jgi:arabinose-5-phosphate isomerase|nr:KpsF/GutQ family sugar-phosphate isomerase [Burkholderiaceae bacterium]MDH5207376.1 KpsF/GutQ family sugar-phosphate isomerase [Burkholderiaceae bacterium]